MKRTWLLAGCALAALVRGPWAPARFWRSPRASPRPASSFLDRVAQKLGIDSPKLKQAMMTRATTRHRRGSGGNGNLTQKQADTLSSGSRTAQSLR